ncbi:MAG: LEPR-XLL domain-containing protein, partial [Phycisphaerales bacterium JB038]
MSWKTLLTTSTYARTVVRRAGLARPTFETLEPRRLLSADLDGTWGAVLSLSETNSDGESFVDSEFARGQIQNGLFTGEVTFFDHDFGDFVSEQVQAQVSRDSTGRLHFTYADDDDIILHTQGGIDPDSMVGWHHLDGMWEEGDFTEYFHDQMIMLRTSVDAQGADLVGQWDFSALNFSFDQDGPLAGALHGRLNFASDGTFVIDDLAAADGLRADMAGSWQLAADGKLDLTLNGDDTPAFSGVFGEMGSV